MPGIAAVIVGYDEVHHETMTVNISAGVGLRTLNLNVSGQIDDGALSFGH